MFWFMIINSFVFTEMLDHLTLQSYIKTFQGPHHEREETPSSGT